MIPGSANPLLLAAAAEEAGAYQISRSVRFNSSDSAYLSKNFGSAGNRKTWTWAGWVKQSQVGIGVTFGAGSDDRGELRLYDAGIVFYEYNGSTYNFNLRNNDIKLRDPAAWMHIVIAFDSTQVTSSNRAKAYINGSLISWTTYTDFPSQNFDCGFWNNANIHYLGRGGLGRYWNGYLADVHFIDGQALDPTSFTEVDATTGQLVPIEYTGTYGTNGFHLPFSDNSSAAALGTDTSGAGNDWTVNNISVNQTVNYNSTLTAVNPSETVGSPENAFDDNLSTTITGIFGGIKFTPLGGSQSGVTSLRFYSKSFGQGGRIKLNGTIIESNYDFGSGGWYSFSSAALSNISNTLTSFEWDRQPGSGSNNNDYLYAIEINGTVLVNTSGAGNDSLVDTPTSYGVDAGNGGEVRGNYATLNPLFSSTTLTNGNLDAEGPSNAWHIGRGTIAFPTSDKWYWEATVTGTSAASYAISVATAAAANSVGDVTTATGLYGIVNNTGTTTTKFVNGTATTISTAAAWAQNDILMCAYDGSTGKVWFGRNGTWYPPTSGGSAGNPGAGTNETMTASGTVFPAVHCYGTTADMAVNFGQRPFAYTAPSGFKALCDTNLPAPVVAQPSTVMDVALWSGTGATQSITFQSGLSPDFVWIKARNAVASNAAFDVIRGANKAIYPNLTNAENTYTATLTSFDSSGFTLGYDDWSGVNLSGRTYVGWAWDAGSSTVTNTQGSITSTVRANQTAGFSIVTYTGTGSAETVGHGLGVEPHLIITKNRSNGSYGWYTYAKAIGNTKYLILEGTAAATTFNLWQDTTPTSSVFYLSSNAAVMNNGNNYVAYCFTPVDGYSSFGSYTGNGSADGPFVYTGFRPRWLLVKISAGNAGHWTLIDTSRSDYNVADNALYADLSLAETPDDADRRFDILSNGFKLRQGTSGQTNGNGYTYIYAAFAESPQKYARAR